MSDLSGKVALVTGGSKGIGKATCQALAKAGASVAINYSSDANSAEQLVQEIGPDHAVAVQANASTVAGAEQMVKATMDRFGRLDIVVCSAGTTPFKALEDTTEDDFDATVALNMKGPYFMAQKAAAVMTAGSHIVFLSTSLCTASMVGPNSLLYCATKGAIEQMARVLSKDLARRNISVNAVAPGPIHTAHFFKGKSESTIRAMEHYNPHDRLGEPEEVADAIVFLSSHESRWITGQVVQVNGGMT